MFSKLYKLIRTPNFLYTPIHIDTHICAYIHIDTRYSRSLVIHRNNAVPIDAPCQSRQNIQLLSYEILILTP